MTGFTIDENLFVEAFYLKIYSIYWLTIVSYSTHVFLITLIVSCVKYMRKDTRPNGEKNAGQDTKRVTKH